MYEHRKFRARRLRCAAWGPIALLAMIVGQVALAGSAEIQSNLPVDLGSWAPIDLPEPSTGDLGEMRARKQIRVLVPFNRTDFFLWRGRPRGFETELLLEYEKFVNAGVQAEDHKVRVVFVPVVFGRLFAALLAGEGDIAAAGLTITPVREMLAAFSEPYLPEVDEIVVTARGVEGLGSIKDLSGRAVYVLDGSSYAQHLQALSQALVSMGLAPIDIVEADDNLSDEDVLELLNAGIVDITVVDRHFAELWSKVLDDIEVRHDLVVNRGGSIGWAIRRSNEQLKRSLDDFVQQIKKGTLVGNMLYTRYFESAYFASNPLTEQERRRLHRYAPLFREYAERYDLDWLAVAAQAFQESGFDPDATSPDGAIGIMQLLPSTAEALGISTAVDGAEANIHAASKYLALLRDRYLSRQIEPADRLAFMWAAYNAGPKKVRAMRDLAGEMGLDPNRWFFNVEHAAQRLVGPETVRHVANVYKYYVAYRLSEELLHKRMLDKRGALSLGEAD